MPPLKPHVKLRARCKKSGRSSCCLEDAEDAEIDSKNHWNRFRGWLAQVSSPRVSQGLVFLSFLNQQKCQRICPSLDSISITPMPPVPILGLDKIARQFRWVHPAWAMEGSLLKYEGKVFVYLHLFFFWYVLCSNLKNFSHHWNKSCWTFLGSRHCNSCRITFTTYMKQFVAASLAKPLDSEVMRSRSKAIETQHIST